MTDWHLQLLGPSMDGRTNRWRVTPGCGHKPFEPPTTMFGTNHVKCPRCGAEAVAHYNAQTITPIED